MMNINEINEAIQTLENKHSTTYDNCIKLAALYIVRDHYYNNNHNEKTVMIQGGTMPCEMDRRQGYNDSIQIKK